MTRVRWTPCVERLQRLLHERGVVAWRRGSTPRLQIEDLDGLRPDGLALVLEALTPYAGQDPTTPLHGWQPIVLVGRDYAGHWRDGKRYGLWLIWRTLWAVHLEKETPPKRPDTIRIVPPLKRLRRRRRQHDQTDGQDVSQPAGLADGQGEDPRGF